MCMMREAMLGSSPTRFRLAAIAAGRHRQMQGGNMNVQADQLEALVAAIFERTESSPEEARTIARHLVGANLVGHDSHGVIRVNRYVEWARDGKVRANQQAAIAFETDCLALVDGHRGYGQVIGEQAVQIGIDKASKCGIALVGLRDVGHVGRVGDWAEMAAEAGQVSLHFVGTTGLGALMVPFGGTDRRLSLCVVAAGVPRGEGPPVIYDVATSVVAEGKVMVAKNKGVPLPEGHLIDKDGNADHRSQRPVRGRRAAAVRRAQRFGAGDRRRPARRRADRRGLDPSARAGAGQHHVLHLRRPGPAARSRGVRCRGRRLSQWVKASPPAAPGGEVLLPGDVERRTRAERRSRGIPLDDTTIGEITEAAVSVGLARAEVEQRFAAARVDPA